MRSPDTDLADDDARILELRRHVQLTRRSDGSALARVFYAELLGRQPKLVVHFAGLDVDALAAKLWSVLALLADADRPDVACAISRFGRLHGALGIGAADYEPFVATLADVLAVRQRLMPAADARRLWRHELEKLAARFLQESPS